MKEHSKNLIAYVISLCAKCQVFLHNPLLKIFSDQKLQAAPRVDIGLQHLLETAIRKNHNSLNTMSLIIQVG